MQKNQTEVHWSVASAPQYELWKSASLSCYLTVELWKLQLFTSAVEYNRVHGWAALRRKQPLVPATTISPSQLSAGMWTGWWIKSSEPLLWKPLYVLLKPTINPSAESRDATLRFPKQMPCWPGKRETPPLLHCGTFAHPDCRRGVWCKSKSGLNCSKHAIIKLSVHPPPSFTLTEGFPPFLSLSYTNSTSWNEMKCRQLKHCCHWWGLQQAPT